MGLNRGTGLGGAGLADRFAAGLGGAGLASGYAAVPILFNGLTWVASDGTTPPAGSKFFCGSMWLKRTGTDNFERIIGNSGANYHILTSGGNLNFAGEIAGGSTDALNVTTNETSINGGAYHHVAWRFSMSLGASGRNVWIDSNDQTLTVTTFTDAAIDWNTGSLVVPAEGGAGAAAFEGTLADIMIWTTDVFASFSPSLFASAAGRPLPPEIAIAALGAPDLRLSGPRAAWATNKGGTGKWAITAVAGGALLDGTGPVQL